MRWMLVLGLCFLSAAQMSGQSAKAAFDAFRDSVVNQQFVLRNFSGETKVHGTWMGSDFQLDAPKWQSFGVLQVRSVKMRGEQIRLQCDRHVVLYNEANGLARYPIGESVEISIDFHGADATQTLPKLREAIFYSSPSDALAGVPKPLQKMVPAHANSASRNDGITKPCDCSTDDPCATAKGAAGYLFPRAIQTPDPEFSEEARRRKINGEIVTAFMVDETGHVHDVWIARPLGYGLDEEAAKTVQAYVFKPATCHGNPVSVPLAAEINFQIF